MNMQRLKMAWKVLTGRADRRFVYLLVPDDLVEAPHVFGNAEGVARALENQPGSPTVEEIRAMKLWDVLPAEAETVWLVPAPAFDFTDCVRYNRLTVIHRTGEGGNDERQQFSRGPVAYTGGQQAGTGPRWPYQDSRLDHQLPIPGTEGAAHRGTVHGGADLQGRPLPYDSYRPTLEEVWESRRFDEDDQGFPV